jgi:hypothetical protein
MHKLTLLPALHYCLVWPLCDAEYSEVGANLLRRGQELVLNPGGDQIPSLEGSCNCCRLSRGNSELAKHLVLVLVAFVFR